MRSDFAASLNSCLDKINQAIAAGTPTVSPEDLAIVQRLRSELAAELTVLPPFVPTSSESPLGDINETVSLLITQSVMDKSVKVNVGFHFVQPNLES